MNNGDNEKQNFKKPTTLRVFVFILVCTFIGFGGGNALMPIVKKYAVEKYKWLTIREFDDIVIAANMIPGPSVVETLSHIAIKLLGFWKGTIISLIAFLPHLLFALLVFVLLNKYASKYLYVLAACVLPVIIGVLINFGANYLKTSSKTIYAPIWIAMFILTFSFCLLVPSPYNIPAIPMVIGIFGVCVHTFIKTKKSNNDPTDTQKYSEIDLNSSKNENNNPSKDGE